MPILDVEVITKASTEVPTGLAARLADAAAEVCGSKAGELWLKLRTLPMRQYAECDGGEGVLPVFVSFLMFRQPDVEERKRIASTDSACFASILDGPAENIHILF